MSAWPSGRQPRRAPELPIEETFDSSAAAGQSSGEPKPCATGHGRRQEHPGTGSKGFAPDSKIYSANKYTNDALTWAIVTKHCTVLNQSFHYDSEETDPGLSAVDLITDYLMVHPPFPTIVQAAGNGPATEYVNHKGSIPPGSAIIADGAAAMRSTSPYLRTRPRPTVIASCPTCPPMARPFPRPA